MQKFKKDRVSNNLVDEESDEIKKIKKVSCSFLCALSALYASSLKDYSHLISSILPLNVVSWVIVHAFVVNCWRFAMLTFSKKSFK